MSQAELHAAVALGLSSAAFVLSCVGAWPHLQQGFVVLRDVVLWVALAAVFLMLGSTFAIRWWPTPPSATGNDLSPATSAGSVAVQQPAVRQ